MPRVVCARVICQYWRAASSPSIAARRLIQKILAPSACCAATWSKIRAASPVTCWASKGIFHQHEDVHIVRGGL